MRFTRSGMLAFIGSEGRGYVTDALSFFVTTP